MSLPLALIEQSCYVIGVDDMGQKVGVVFLSQPFTPCKECGVAHGIMIVADDQSYRCCWCAGMLRMK